MKRKRHDAPSAHWSTDGPSSTSSNCTFALRSLGILVLQRKAYMSGLSNRCMSIVMQMISMKHGLTYGKTGIAWATGNYGLDPATQRYLYSRQQ